MQFKTKPYKHQLQCLQKFCGSEYYALLAEQGTGKSWIIINDVAKLWQNDQCDALLILAPNGVQTNWVRLEIPKHMPDGVEYCALDAKEKIEKLYRQRPRVLRILAMNWEALQSKRWFLVAERFCNTASNLMIACDESDAVKNPKALRTKALFKLKKYSKYRRIITGTPVSNAPFDLFSQFTFLNQDILGTSSFYAFKAEYAEMEPSDSSLMYSIRNKMQSGRIPQIVRRENGKACYKNLDRLSGIIDPVSFRVLKKDCLDLPEKIYKTVYFDLTAEQKKIYQKATEEHRLEYQGEETIFTKLVLVTKLAQITSGYYKHPATEEPVRIAGDNPKLDLLAERVEKIVEAGGKIIIWARYTIEIEDIAKKLAHHNCVLYYGKIKKKERTEAIDSFENGEADIFIGNQQAGGRGLTLVAANNMIYFSNNFSLRDRLQSEDRAHRIGQTKNVIYTNIIAKNTVDEMVLYALENKLDVSEAILTFNEL